MYHSMIVASVSAAPWAGKYSGSRKSGSSMRCIFQELSDGRLDAGRVGPANGLQLRREGHRHVGGGQQPRRTRSAARHSRAAKEMMRSPSPRVWPDSCTTNNLPVLRIDS